MKGMKLRLEKPGKDCQSCALEFYFMKYCTKAIAKFGNFKFVKWRTNLYYLILVAAVILTVA